MDRKIKKDKDKIQNRKRRENKKHSGNDLGRQIEWRNYKIRERREKE